MVDNNQSSDEYEFADLDAMSPDSMGDDDLMPKSTHPSMESSGSGGTNVKRNALIVLVLIVVALLVYKFMGSFFSKKTTAGADSGVIVPPVSMQPKQPIIESKPVIVQPTVPIVTPSVDPGLNQKLAALDLNQQNIRSDVNGLSNQLATLNTNVDNLNAKIANLTQMVTVLSSKVEQQSSQISLLIAAREKPKPRPVVRRVIVPQAVYYIQAVIPGRAWLIAPNGSTLTVREGTTIAGYGIVKLIDPNQGRVVTSSGRIIRFSQQDS